MTVTDILEYQGKLTAAETSMDGKNMGIPVDRMGIVENNKFLAAHPSLKCQLKR